MSPDGKKTEITIAFDFRENTILNPVTEKFLPFMGLM